jgi:hypothetical protein
MTPLKKAEDLDWSNPVVSLITDVIDETDEQWILSSPIPGMPNYLVPKDAPMELILGWSPWSICVGSRVKVETKYTTREITPED